MVFKNYSQNRWNSESNVSKNISKPCVSNVSECRVKKLIQKYEDRSVSAKNINLRSGIKYCSSEQYISKRHSEMLGDNSINLDKINVLKFLSLHDYETKNKYEFRDCGENENIHNSYSAHHVEDTCDTKMPSQSTSSLKSKFKSYTDEPNKSSTLNTKRKEDNFWKIFTNFMEPDKYKKHDFNVTKKNEDRKQEYSSSLPTDNKKQENSFGKSFIRSFSATSSRDKKLKTQPLSTTNQQYKRDNILPKDGSSVVKTKTMPPAIPNTGAIKKQRSCDDVIYRRRRDSYLMATQNDDNFRKQKCYPEKLEHNLKQSYVSKKISQFETSDMTRKSKNKFEHEIKQLLQHYHDNKKFGTSNKMTREELSLEINNVLLNKFHQISSDNPQEVSVQTSGAGNHNNLDSTSENTEPDDTITLIVEQPEDLTPKHPQSEETNIETNYVIIVHDPINETSNNVAVHNISQGQSSTTSKLNLETTDSEMESELNVREKLSAQLTKVLSKDNINNSVEDLCNDIQKDLNAINKRLSEFGVEISDISVIEPDDENMFDDIDHRSLSCPNNLNKTEEGIYENHKYIQEKINEREQSDENIEVFLRESDVTETKPKRKVSNLVSYFTDIIQEISSDSRRTTLDNRTSSYEQKPNYDDEVFGSPTTERIIQEFRYSTVSTPETNQKHNFNPVFSSDISSSSSTSIDTREATARTIDRTLEDHLQNNVASSSTDILPQRSSLSRRSSNISSEVETIHPIYENLKSVRKQAEQFRDELQIETNHKRQHSLNENNEVVQIYKGTVGELKPRLSRLYSGKFLRNPTKSVEPDTNNNEFIKTSHPENTTDTIHVIITTDKNDTLTEKPENPENLDETDNSTLTDETTEDKQIYDFINQDTTFNSDSEGDYDGTETFNYANLNFFTLEPTSPSEWVQKTIAHNEQYSNENYDDFDEDEDTEHIYERIKRSGSSGTLCTIYDEQNNPAIRLSMLDISKDTERIDEQIEDQKIEESRKEIKKNIEEIQDNSKKACLINELITTEKKYINISLHRLVHDYMPEMDKTDIPKGLVGKSRQIFGNADIIYESQKEKFLPELENHTCIEDLAVCFLKYETIFKLYPLYSKNKPKSDMVLRDYGAFFKAKQDALNDKLDLASYLLSPVQRLAKYCLMLKSLVKECEKESIPCEKLKHALEMLNKQMRMGNDLIALDSIINYNGNIRDQGEVLLRDTFMVQPPNKKPAYEGMLFLFQECLIITAVNRQDFMESFIYKESFQLTDIGYSDIESEPLEFSVWYRKRDIKMYRFRTKNQEVKQKWVKEIFNLLWKQLEANKRLLKKQLVENGVRDTRVPVIRPYTVPNKGQNTVKRKDSGSSIKKSTRKGTLNSSSTDTIWYTFAST